MLIGFCKDVPGGWAEEMIVHRSQLFPVPDALSDKTAVLIEPLSVAVHAVLKSPPPADAKVLIIGSGTIGLLVLSALRLLGHACDVTVLARHPMQEAMAKKLGATRVLKNAGEAAIQVAGAKSYKPIKGKPSYAGGFDWVFDCAGSNRSVDDALRVAGPNAHVVMVGCAAELSHIDVTWIWARELQISGCYVYGKEHGVEQAPHTFEITMKLLEDHPELPLGEIVTHIVPLADWREAMQLSLRRGSRGAIKVAFDCRPQSASGEPAR
jgi:threonine dehydrogenase-like Zn-dependent dehydrogenase